MQKLSIAPDACCGPDCCANDQTKAVIREKYGAVAESTLSNNDAGVRAVAEAFGYSEEELSSIPADANMGLSCGNPTATASIKPGETVVDLGSGGGLDVFLAAKKVGPNGKAIGIDMTPAMIERARKNARDAGLENVEFHQSSIDTLPLAPASVDCIISNCVINLAPDKAAVFGEMFRVLKPGGRVAVSDIALKKPLPTELANSLAALVGCIAGAIPTDQFERGLIEAGFTAVVIQETGADLNAYAQVDGQAACCSPAMDRGRSANCCESQVTDHSLHGELSTVLAAFDVNEHAASVKVYAVKPRTN